VFGLAELLKNIAWFMSWGMKESILCKGVIIIDGCLYIPSRQPASAPDTRSRGVFRICHFNVKLCFCQVLIGFW
jgi:hypothetical protein